jgi:hypothetical protein
MRSASSGLAFAMLLLVQILAPLLHVHTSGNTGNGILHVPGLESLYLAHNNTAQPPHAEQTDGLVVGIAQGLRQPLDTSISFASSHDAIRQESSIAIPAILNARLQRRDAVRQTIIRDRSSLSPPTRGPPA